MHVTSMCVFNFRNTLLNYKNKSKKRTLHVFANNPDLTLTPKSSLSAVEVEPVARNSAENTLNRQDEVNMNESNSDMEESYGLDEFNLETSTTHNNDDHSNDMNEDNDNVEENNSSEDMITINNNIVEEVIVPNIDMPTSIRNDVNILNINLNENSHDVEESNELVSMIIEDDVLNNNAYDLEESNGVNDANNLNNNTNENVQEHNINQTSALNINSDSSDSEWSSSQCSSLGSNYNSNVENGENSIESDSTDGNNSVDYAKFKHVAAQ